MNEMIERAMWAIIDAGYNPATAKPIVRIVIETMRKPTAAMARHAANECSTIDLAGTEDFQKHYADVWESMIDAALGNI